MSCKEESILKVSKRHFRKITTFCKPLNDHFKINHFWYYKITNEGLFSYLGSHQNWNEIQFGEKLHLVNPYIRHPSTLEQGISLMPDVEDSNFRHQLSVAKNKCSVHMYLNLSFKTVHGMEGFGFGSTHSSNKIKNMLLNEQALLTLFYKQFRKENRVIFDQLDDFQVDLSKEIGPAFFVQKSSIITRFSEREYFLKQIGIEDFKPLSKQEKNITKKLVEGFTAKDIALDLLLSKRTVEHYIENIKNKLNCYSKKEIIQKVLELNLIEKI